MPRISAATIGEHRAQTQDRILRAVSRLSREQGIDAISMTDVASEAEITRTVLYNYFPDKAALLLAFTERVTHYFIDGYERELPERASSAEQLRVFVRLQLEGLLAHPHPGPADLSAALGPDAYQRLADHVEPMQRILTGIIDSGVASGDFHTLDVAATSRFILAVIGAERVPLLSGAVTPEEAEEMVLEFVLRGLGSLPHPPDAG
ncbi:TetR/AcrR family transcriptional regulator [Streptosporangium sp. NBC_01755]|uniref:TetR/AcrR family transcriptional regulator n=1 Tax=unclassified Streptosporangium TaxID=2632669 RepID=UPI002DDAF498|nr:MULTISPECIES: TetR/AcrR family transcriptional regulator [unclassified Streptosporangium]WSA28034.1 TetR/AcrR family transcriptional regulator [Streptosporangium sp. NBC_01810]WSD00494.1 TetR/AcrR family transcriptional regulator [Streptosporangium sp. NBC_01755]